MASVADWSALSLTGKGSHLNQDRFGANGTLFCVADGMGGPAGGHHAATSAVRAFMAAQPTDAPSLESAIHEAAQAVKATSANHPGQGAMGTTLTAVLVTGSGLLVVSVGDTRCYLSNRTEIHQLTVDDTIAQSLGISPDDERYDRATATLTRSLGGHGPIPDCHVIEQAIDEPCTVLVTTDGIHDHVEPDALRCRPEEHLDQHLLNLADAAQAAGSQDDLTALAIAVQP